MPAISIESSVLESMIGFFGCIEKQTQVIKDMVEKRLDVEHDIFTLKELNENVKTDNTALKEKHEKFEKFEKKADENCGMPEQ